MKNDDIYYSQKSQRQQGPYADSMVNILIDKPAKKKKRCLSAHKYFSYRKLSFYQEYKNALDKDPSHSPDNLLCKKLLQKKPQQRERTHSTISYEDQQKSLDNLLKPVNKRLPPPMLEEYKRIFPPEEYQTPTI